MEAANFIALNLVHDAATGKRSVEEARKEYGQQIIAVAEGKPTPLAQRLTLQTSKNAGDSYKQTLEDSTVNKVKNMMKEKEDKK